VSIDLLDGTLVQLDLENEFRAAMADASFVERARK
jgi:hypothetical protein